MRTGAYASPDDVIDQALEMLRERDSWLLDQRDEIAAKIEAGYASAKRGHLIDGDVARAGMEDRKRAWLEQRSKG